LCFSESSLSYEANHQGLYDGICGVNPHLWSDYLKDIGVDYNSLKGGFEVYKYYLSKTNNKKKAILEFKGVEKNKKVKKIVDNIFIIERKIR